MPRTRAQFDRLLAELHEQVGLLDGLLERNQRAEARIQAGAVDELDWAALGYTIHNFYNSVEAYCLLIAKFFENDLDPRTWHRDLLRRMTLDIAGVRPRLLDRELAAALDEFRAFRHVFRNVYGATLDPERVRILQSRVGAAAEGFRLAHERFSSKIRSIAKAIET
jgi:hypothetical protein